MNKSKRKVLEAALNWVNRIDPDTNPGAWADDEDMALIEAVKRYQADIENKGGS